MKPILISVFALLVASSLQAQKFQVGLNGGAVFSTSSLVSPQYHSDQHIFTAGTVSAQFDARHWQYGFSVGYRAGSFSTAYDEYIWCGYPSSPPNPLSFKVHGSFREIPFRLFADRKITFKRMEMYIGSFLGYTFSTDKYFISESLRDYQTAYHNHWLVGGIQVGGTYFITKQLGINAGIATEYNVLLSNLNYDRHFYPITLGLRYKF